jgi:hypothetical protein
VSAVLSRMFGSGDLSQVCMHACCDKAICTSIHLQAEAYVCWEQDCWCVLSVSLYCIHSLYVPSSVTCMPPFNPHHSLKWLELTLCRVAAWCALILILALVWCVTSWRLFNAYGNVSQNVANAQPAATCVRLKWQTRHRV